MNVYVGIRLPSEYQEVEYIASSGTQYISTGLTLSPNITFEFQFQLLNTDNNQGIIGARGSGNTNRHSLITYDSVFHFMTGDNNGWNGSVDLNKHTVKLTGSNNNWNINADGTNYSATGTVNTNNSLPYYIFRNGGQNTSYVKMYYVKFYNSGTLVRNFVPCYRKTDSVIGMYDLVNDTFYTNSGTGTFSKGNDVTMAELKNAYIGDGWWRLSTDFTQYSSLAQIQAQGWTGTTYSTSTSPTFSYGSNGIGVYSSSGSKHGGIYVKLPNKITAQNKVVMKYTGTVSQIDGGIYMTLSTYNTPDLQASTQADFSYSQSYRSGSTGQGLGISKNVNGTKSWGFWQDSRTIQGTAGTYEVEVRLDMPNSKAKWICTSPSGMAYTSEATISSDGMASIIGMEYFIIWGVCYSSGVTDYIKSGEIAVI